MQQERSANVVGLAIRKNARFPSSNLAQQVHHVLKVASKTMQSFDRDGHPEFSESAMKITQDFSMRKDVDDTINQLESLLITLKLQGDLR